jgi:folate-binding protein YgfZ
MLLVTPPGMGESTAAALDHYLFAEKVSLEDVSGRHALLMLIGPAADDTAKRLTGAVPPDAAWSHVAGSLDGIEVRLVRGGGELDAREVWLLTPSTERERAWKGATAAGARPLGAAAVESLRIERGTPRFGADVDAGVLLPEIPAEHLISHTKGCYPGQEVVVRIRDRGHVNRHLRGLLLDGDVVPPRGAEVVADDAAVGQVTSATLSLGLGRPIALAFVRRQHAPGARVGVRTDRGTLPATVSDLPLSR